MKKRGALAAGVLAVAAVLAALVVAPGRKEAASPPISIVAKEVRPECLSGTFVPGSRGWASAEMPSPRDWSRIEAARGAVQADRGAVEVTVIPRAGARQVTLTGIGFKTAYYSRPEGGDVFYRPCKRRLPGAALEFDLDPAPARVIASSRTVLLHGPLGLTATSHAIHFPWTVTLHKPLHLFLIVNADDSYCTWTARLKWRKGSAEGAVPIDDHGRRYRIVDTTGVSWLEPHGRQWTPTRNFAEGQSSVP